jgi:hypothetical protein
MPALRAFRRAKLSADTPGRHDPHSGVVCSGLLSDAPPELQMGWVPGAGRNGACSWKKQGGSRSEKTACQGGSVVGQRKAPEDRRTLQGSCGSTGVSPGGKAHPCPGRLDDRRIRLKPGRWTRRQDAARYGRRDARRHKASCPARAVAIPAPSGTQPRSVRDISPAGGRGLFSFWRARVFCR